MNKSPVAHASSNNIFEEATRVCIKHNHSYKYINIYILNHKAAVWVDEVYV